MSHHLGGSPVVDLADDCGLNGWLPPSGVYTAVAGPSSSHRESQALPGGPEAVAQARRQPGTASMKEQGWSRCPHAGSGLVAGGVVRTGGSRTQRPQPEGRGRTVLDASGGQRILPGAAARGSEGVDGFGLNEWGWQGASIPSPARVHEALWLFALVQGVGPFTSSAAPQGGGSMPFLGRHKSCRLTLRPWCSARRGRFHCAGCSRRCRACGVRRRSPAAGGAVRRRGRRPGSPAIDLTLGR